MQNNIIMLNTYETDELISQYLEFHYGDEYFGVSNFPKACIDIILEQFNEVHFTRALDLGCAVGRSSLELALQFEQVDAVDYSSGFIEHAKQLVAQREISFSITDEGELERKKTVSLESLGLLDTAERVSFAQGDASDLSPQYTHYDLIFAGNLIDRLIDPKFFLESIHHRINKGGFLVLTSPYTWLEEFTPKENWLGGYVEEGAKITTLAGLTKTLEGNFKQIVEPIDVPFVIRETARKHQHTIAQMTLWKKL